MALVLFAGSLISAAPMDKLEEDGGASECAQYARGVVLNAADEYGLDISRGGAHFNLMMEFYHEIYADCYNN